MARNIFVKLRYGYEIGDRGQEVPIQTFTIAGGASRTLDIDLKEAANAQFCITGAYAATSGSTGISITAYLGCGPDEPDIQGHYSLPCILDGVTNPDIIIGDNGSAVATATYTGGGPAESKNTFTTTSNLIERNPRWLRFIIDNDDATEEVTISIVADL